MTRHRQVIALLALIGFLLSTYLLLHRFGLVGELACGAGGGACERVQASRYADFLGLPVAAYGVAGYLGLLLVALAGLQPRWLQHPGPTRLLVALAALGTAFTAYLKYLELFRIHAICRWCLGSAVIIVAILVLGIVGMRRAKQTA